MNLKLPEIKIAKKVRTCTTTKVDIDIAYAEYTPSAGYATTTNPPILCVSGQGGTLFAYEPDFAQAVADRANTRVIVMDNRDVGHSTKFDEPCGQPWLYSLLAPTWCSPYPAYFINDFALDCWALIDAVVGKNSQVALVGTSMGGAIIAAMFLNAPQRVLSLSFLFSSTFGPGLPGASWKTSLSFLQGPKSDEMKDRLEHKSNFFARILYPPLPEEEIKKILPLAEARAKLELQHSLYRAGGLRQITAVLHSPDREPGLKALQAQLQAAKKQLPPMLIVSGDSDRILPSPDHYQRLCEVFPTAEKIMLRAAGHFMERRFFDEMSTKLADVYKKATATTTNTGAAAAAAAATA